MREPKTEVILLEPISGAMIRKGFAGKEEVLFIDGKILTKSHIENDRQSRNCANDIGLKRRTEWYFMRKIDDMWCYAASGLDEDVALYVEKALYHNTGKATRTKKGNVIVCVGKLTNMTPRYKRTYYTAYYTTKASYDFPAMRLNNGMVKCKLSPYITIYNFMHKRFSREIVEQDLAKYFPLLVSGGCLVEMTLCYYYKPGMRLVDLHSWT